MPDRQMSKRASTFWAAALGLVLLSLSFAAAAALRSAQVTRVSIASDGAEADDWAGRPAVSADGRFVAFESPATNLMPDDENGTTDVFVHDRQTGQTQAVSVTPGGAAGNRSSERPAISDDGRYVAFMSTADNLTAGDTNQRSDVFVRDRQSATTTRVSVAGDGTEGNYGSQDVDISGDGRFVAFQSSADNLVPGDENGQPDIFVHDLQSGETALVSRAMNGTQADEASWEPALSRDGRYVVFRSEASTLVPAAANGHADVFLHDRQSGATTLLSAPSDGWSGEPDISADGRFITFRSFATNLTPELPDEQRPQVFLHDRESGETMLASAAADGTPADGWVEAPSLSAGGEVIVFASAAGNLVTGDDNGWNDIFLYRHSSGSLTRVSVTANGTPANDFSSAPAVAADGEVVVYESWATNLVENDGNDTYDVFVYDIQDAAQPEIVYYLPLVR